MVNELKTQCSLKSFKQDPNCNGRFHVNIKIYRIRKGRLVCKALSIELRKILRHRD